VCSNGTSDSLSLQDVESFLLLAFLFFFLFSSFSSLGHERVFSRMRLAIFCAVFQDAFFLQGSFVVIPVLEPFKA
jgi:hypothetical protein